MIYLKFIVDTILYLKSEICQIEKKLCRKVENFWVDFGAIENIFQTKSHKIFPKYENQKSCIKSIKILRNMKIQNPKKKRQKTQKYHNQKLTIIWLKILKNKKMKIY
jgi:Zn-finger nucleic acid-binding protein